MPPSPAEAAVLAVQRLRPFFAHGRDLVLSAEERRAVQGDERADAPELSESLSSALRRAFLVPMLLVAGRFLQHIILQALSVRDRRARDAG